MDDPQELDDEARFKLALMDIIDEDLRDRFRTVEEAADFANVDCIRLFRLRSRQQRQFSVAWLFRLARSAKIRIRIHIEPGRSINKNG